MNISDIKNPELFEKLWTRVPLKEEDFDNKKFIVIVLEEQEIVNLSFPVLENSKHELFLPIFLSYKDFNDQNMIKGKNFLMCDFNTIREIVETHKDVKGIAFNPCKLDYKINRKDLLKFKSVKRDEDYKHEYHIEESFNMADLKINVLEPRMEVLDNIIVKLEETSIKKAYIIFKRIGDKFEYKFIFDYNKKDEFFIDIIREEIEKNLNEDEIYSIENTKSGLVKNMIRNMKPFYSK